MQHRNLNLELNWDVEEGGELTVFIRNEETGDELTHLNLGYEEIIPEFFDDVQEYEDTGDEDVLLDWESLAEDMAEMAQRIKTQIKSSRTQRDNFKKNLLAKGMATA